MDTGEFAALTGLCTAVGTLIGAAAVALINILRGRSEIRLSENKQKAELGSAEHRATLSEWQEIASELRGQSERQDHVIRQLQRAMQLLQEENVDCREDYTEVKTANLFLYGLVKHLHALAGSPDRANPGPLPEMPKFRERKRRSREEVDFAVAQATQSAGLVREVDKSLKPGNAAGSSPPK